MSAPVQKHDDCRRWLGDHLRALVSELGNGKAGLGAPYVLGRLVGNSDLSQEDFNKLQDLLYGETR